MKRLAKWWYFTFRNPKVRVGANLNGGFSWVFRRFWMEISTISGNFRVRVTAGEHPFGYLVAGKGDENIEGYCQTVYTVAMLLTTDQGFVNDVNKAIQKYQKRLEKNAKVVEDEDEEKIALEGEKALQERIEMSPKERRKADRETDKRFKETVRKAENTE